MIYFLAEYCLDSLNGSFFQSAQALLDSDCNDSFYAPFIALYVAIIGFNTLETSIVLSQFMFLYKLFHSIDKQFVSLIKLVFSNQENPIYIGIYNLVYHIPVIPLIISISLHIAYVSITNKSRSLLSRILHSITRSLVCLIFTNIILCALVVFIINYILMDIFTKNYLAVKLRASAMLLSFCGVYFFVKTYKKVYLFSNCIRIDFVFTVEYSHPLLKQVVMSYLIFIFLFAASFYLQLIVARILKKVVKKKKTI